MSTTGYPRAAPTSTTATAPACTATADPGRQETTTRLAELICADPEWLQREFTELIEANYPPAAAAPARAGPPRHTGVLTGMRPTRRWPGNPRSSRAAPRLRHGTRRAAADGPARQRSPPSRAAADSSAGPRPVIVTRPDEPGR